MSQSWDKPRPLVPVRSPLPLESWLMCQRGCGRVGSAPLYPPLLWSCLWYTWSSSPPKPESSTGLLPEALPLWAVSGTTSQGVGNFPFQACILFSHLSYPPGNHYNTEHKQLFVKGAKPWCHWERGSRATNQHPRYKRYSFTVSCYSVGLAGLSLIHAESPWAYLAGSLY